jgi:hypothetical protein
LYPIFAFFCHVFKTHSPPMFYSLLPGSGRRQRRRLPTTRPANSLEGILLGINGVFSLRGKKGNWTGLRWIRPHFMLGCWFLGAKTTRTHFPVHCLAMRVSVQLFYFSFFPSARWWIPSADIRLLGLPCLHTLHPPYSLSFSRFYAAKPEGFIIPPLSYQVQPFISHVSVSALS